VSDRPLFWTKLSGGRFGLVEAHSLSAYFGGAAPDEELRIQAELVAISSPAMLDADHSIESEAFTIGDFDAATATATAADPWGIGDVGSSPDDLEGENGVIAILNEIHDSIDVQ
jgi:hypothetical protein